MVLQRQPPPFSPLDDDPERDRLISSLLADLLQGGHELRPAQLDMALQVSQALKERTCAIIEAGTGTGKTYSYLIPLIRSGLTAIISTANKALQEQLFYKDIPFLQEHVQPFDAALVKGWANFICLDRLHEARKEGGAFGVQGELGRVFDVIGEDSGFTGDLELLGFPLPVELRSRINGDADACSWAKCEFYERCYIRRMKDRAHSARVIIVNHTLLLLDAAAQGAILPDRDVIVVDEGHKLADEATSAFTASVRPTQVSSLLALRAIRAYAAESLYDEIAQLNAHLWARVESTPFGTASRVTFREPFSEALALSKKLAEMASLLRLRRPPDQAEKEKVLYDKLITRILNLASHLTLVFSARFDDYVHYLERGNALHGRAPTVQACAAPLDVAPFLREQLFEKTSTIILCSATLATVGAHPTGPVGLPELAYFRGQVGLDAGEYPRVIERILPPVFDFGTHALLYVPRHLPEPAYGQNEAARLYVRAIADEMSRLVRASRGRAFLLFSSRRMLDEVYQLLSTDDLPFPLLRQGDFMRTELIRRFRVEGGVLFGLKSFWEGVDIPGEALSLVAIDRLPFSPPEDPVQEARVAQMKARGEDWFGGFVLPQVVLQLKQGVGRLLRTPHDRGVMAILDVRLHTKGYGRGVLGALPPARRSLQMADVERFFADS